MVPPTPKMCMLYSTEQETKTIARITIRLTKVSEERISAEAKEKAVSTSHTGNKDGLIRTIKKPLRQLVALKTAKRGE